MLLRLLAVVIVTCVFSPAYSLEYQVVTTSETSLYANMVLIKGEKSVMLVDAAVLARRCPPCGGSHSRYGLAANEGSRYP